MIRFAQIDPFGKVLNLTHGEPSWPWVAMPQTWVPCPDWVSIGDSYNFDTQTFTEA